MVAKVKVLIKGYIELLSEFQGRVRPTIVLIDNGVNKIIVDPGTVKSQNIIHNALKKENLTVNDITHVLITHSHLDHYRNLGMFPNAIAIDFWGYWIKDTTKLFNRSEHDSNSKFKILKDIQVLKTPGHDYSCVTFFVNGETIFEGKVVRGVIAICGDVFWKEDFPLLEDEPFATDKSLLKKSRELVLNNSDYIIPGHDDIFNLKAKTLLI